MKLGMLSVLLGALVSVPALVGLWKPAQMGAAARRFPRSLTSGYALVALATGWFLYYLTQETVSDFAAYKNGMYFGFTLLGVLTCFFLTDLLAVRGLAVVLMLLAKLMIDTAIWVDTSWRLVIMVWAYVLVIAGMWFTISPWRCRDLIDWATATEQRIRIGSALRLAFGLFVIILGVTVFRAG